MTTSGGRAAALFVLSLLVDFSWAGHTTCASQQLDWYTSVVGENPCETYQRLRQICNVDYQVPFMSSMPPGDKCDGQVADCCCNTIAFQLSMLCLNCQHDREDGSIVGVDAPAGTYQQYLNGCGAQHIDSLSTDVQAAVCNLNIRLDDYLYQHWSDGSWFYVWTKENAGEQHAAHNNNTFTHCPNQVSASGLPSTSVFGVSTTDSAASATFSTQATDGSTATPIGAESTKSVPNGGTVAGIVVSIITVLALGALALWLVRRRRTNQMRASRPYRWTAAHPQMRSVPSDTGAYASRAIPPSPVSTLPNPHSPAAQPRLVFSPDAMVRNPVRRPSPALYEVIPGRSSRNAHRSNGHSRDRSHDDSRVQESIDDTPDPDLPLVPLRLETKEGKY